MTSAVAKSSPTVPDAPDVQKVSFTSKDAPIKEVTVFCQDEAEVMRVVTFSSPSQLGLHEVVVTDLPGNLDIEEDSVRVKGSGHCTILHVGYSDHSRNASDGLSAEEMEEIRQADKRREEKSQRLCDEQKVLHQKIDRTKKLRELADSFINRVVISTTAGNADGGTSVGSSKEPAPTVDEVGKALGWWSKTVEETDLQLHSMQLEDRKLARELMDVRSQRRGVLPRMQKGSQQVVDGAATKPGRIIVNLDVLELGPIELEVTYMILGATWWPAYDIRVDTQTDTISCTYYGRVQQKTKEDWEGVTLRLSTAEPTTRGTPPPVGSKIVSIKAPPPVPSMEGGTLQQPRLQKATRSTKPRSGDGVVRHRRIMPDELNSMHSIAPDGLEDISGCGGRGRDAGPQPMRAPPLPPPARGSVARVECGGAGGSGGGIGAVSFVIAQSATIKSKGQTKRLTVGELQLSAEVTHYIVPSKKPAAYLQAKATNNTEYLLLASDEVSIFFDNSFITKTSLTSVSPGESFQTFLGIDPAVKITVAPPRKTSKQRGLFSKWNYVTHTHSTSVFNTKQVPVTCVVVDAVPRSADDVIKVTLKQPQPGSLSESEAITDDVLASAALEMFGGSRMQVGSSSSSGNDVNPDDRSLSTTSSASNVVQGSKTGTQNGVAGVTKSPSNHLAWVGKILPQGEIRIPLQYVVEWPAGQEIEMSE